MTREFFAAYYKAKRGEMIAYAFTLCKSRADADDIVQTVSLCILRALDGIEPYDMDAYTRTAIKNNCITRAQSFHRRAFLRSEAAVLRHGGSTTPAVWGKLELLETIQRTGKELLLSAMGYNVEEIAQSISRTKSTTLARIQKQQKQLTGKTWALPMQKRAGRWHAVEQCRANEAKTPESLLNI